MTTTTADDLIDHHYLYGGRRRFVEAMTDETDLAAVERYLGDVEGIPDCFNLVEDLRADLIGDNQRDYPWMWGRLRRWYDALDHLNGYLNEPPDINRCDQSDRGLAFRAFVEGEARLFTYARGQLIEAAARAHSPEWFDPAFYGEGMVLARRWAGWGYIAKFNAAGNR